MRHFSVRTIAVMIVLFAVAIGVAAQADGVPGEITVDTLYDGSLYGPVDHTLELERGGDYVLFVTASADVDLMVRIAGEPPIAHVFTEGSRNFVFLDDLAPGRLLLEFAPARDADDSQQPYYGFVISPSREISVDASVTDETRVGSVYGADGEIMGIRMFTFIAPDDAVLRVTAEGDIYAYSIYIGSDHDLLAQSGYDFDQDDDTVRAEIAVEAGSRYAMLVLQEIDQSTDRTLRLEFDERELVNVEPIDIGFDEPTMDILEPDVALIGGRMAVPYRYVATEGEVLAILLQSEDFDTYLYVEHPNGLVRTDDDGAWDTNSLVSFEAPESGAYTIYASSYGGSESGLYELLVTDPDTLESIVAEHSMLGDEQWYDEEPLEDFEADVTEIAVDETLRSEISEESSVYQNRYAEIFEITVPRGARLTVSLESDDFDTYLIVETPNGRQFTDDDGGSETNSRLMMPDLDRGTYRIIASSYDGRSVGNLTISVSPYEAGPDAGSADAVMLRSGQLVDGEISATSPVYEGNLVEVFSFLPREGDFVRLTMRSDDFDTFLYVVTPEGFLVTDDDSAGFTDSEVTIGDASGDVHRVYAGSYDGQSTGEFTITVELEKP